MKSLLWQRHDRVGLERFTLSGEHVLEGTVIVWLGGPYEVQYEIACAPTWETIDASIVTGGTTLEIRRDGARWMMNGQHVPAVDGCIDIDIGVTPSTNTLPIRRLSLGVGESREVTAAWLRFPELSLEPLVQRYTRLAERTYLYESPSFRAELEVDGDGVVTRYGDVWSVVVD